MQCRAGQVRDRRLKRTETIVKRQQRVSPKRDDRGSVGPTVISSNVARFRHFATVLGLIPSSRLSCASEACPYRDIALQCPAGQRDRGAPVTNLSHAASSHSFEKIAPSNHGIKYLGWQPSRHLSARPIHHMAKSREVHCAAKALALVWWIRPHRPMV